MSTTDTTPTVTWQDWQHRRTPVKAIQYDGTEACRHVIADGVNRWAGPGLARIQPTGTLLVRTQLRWAQVPPGYWVGIGYHDHPWVITHEVFTGCYDPAGDADYNAVLDRDTAAALVVAAEDCNDPVLLREWIHQLAMTAEALR